MYFHVAPILLAPGSLVLPGNWGRILRLYTQANDVLFRESALENFRQSKCPEKPSRLNSVFLLETLEEAIWYRNNNSSTSLIYEVNISTSDAVIHRGNYTKVGPVNIPLLEHMPLYAESYWSSVPVDKIEIVCPVPVTIIAQRG
jgi:hypothetical protein